ncbi:MAG TPA: hypothetical protein DHW49_04965 [Anaerolineae bacterium]|nr:hypothetical protein [Anaerolineae bacterium]
MNSRLFNKVEKLNKISLIFGILSVSMPILLISLPILMRIFQLQDIQIDLLTWIINFLKISGVLFGLIGYFISRQVLTLTKYEKVSDELISKTQASRTWNIIGIVICLAILCGSLNRGIAF